MTMTLELLIETHKFDMSEALDMQRRLFDRDGKCRRLRLMHLGSIRRSYKTDSDRCGNLSERIEPPATSTRFALSFNPATFKISPPNPSSQCHEH